MVDQYMTQSDLTVQELYDFCKKNGALDYAINFTVQVYDPDTDNHYDSSVNDLGMNIYVNVDDVNHEVDLFPEA